jgi:ferredoxin-NADP reductase
MRMRLVERRREAAGVESFIFEPREPVSWRAGQFLHYVLHHEPTDDRGSDRWFTVSAAPYEGRVMLTTRVTAEQQSSFKKALIALELGSEALEVSDIDGDFVIDPPAGGPTSTYVFIAGGIGITPYRAILKQLDHDGADIHATLLYGNRDRDIPFKAELDALAGRHAGLQIHYLVAPEKIDEAAIRQYVPDLAAPTFYVSGPEPMVESLHGVLKGMGVAPERLKGDWFPGYPAE